MIKLKVRGEIYTISKDYSVSDGIAKEYIEMWIEMIRFEYYSTGGTANGFFPLYLYIKLANVKSITLLSIDYKPPAHDEGFVY